MFRICHFKRRSDERSGRGVWRKKQIHWQRRDNRRLIHIQHSNVERTSRLNATSIPQRDLNDILIHLLIIQSCNQLDSACVFIDQEGGKVAVLDALHSSIHAIVLILVVHRTDCTVHQHVFSYAELVLEEERRLVYIIHYDCEGSIVVEWRFRRVHHSNHHVEHRTLLVVQSLLGIQFSRVGVD